MSKAPIRIPNLQTGTVTFEQFAANTQDRFYKNEVLIYSVLVIVGITLVATLVGATAIVLDQLHFNNQLYRDGEYTRTNTILKTERVIEQPIFPTLKEPTN